MIKLDILLFYGSNNYVIFIAVNMGAGEGCGVVGGPFYG